MNNFLNNAELKIILCKIVEIVYTKNSEQFLWEKKWTILINVENRFYECSKQIWIYSKHDGQNVNFINVENFFYQYRKINSIIVKFKHEKAFRFGV